jgi:mono/diheme cytochrome c family protein
MFTLSGIWQKAIPPFALLSILGLASLFPAACKSTRNAQGEWLYGQYCANCHMESGQGLRGVIPPLAGADYLSREREQIACIIRYGQQGPIRVNGREYNQLMPGVENLNAVEITNIINYINQAWGNDLPYFPLDSVKAGLDACSEREVLGK